MKEPITIASNPLFVVDQNEKPKPSAEVVITLAEPTYEIDRSRTPFKTSELTTIRFLADREILQRLIDGLQSCQAMIEEMEFKYTITKKEDK